MVGGERRWFVGVVVGVRDGGLIVRAVLVSWARWVRLVHRVVVVGAWRLSVAHRCMLQANASLATFPRPDSIFTATSRSFSSPLKPMTR